MQDIIKQLDAEIQRKQPKGILISIPLFNALRDLERIADQQLVFPGTSIPVFTYPMLDKKVFVTTAFLNDGEYYRLPT